MFPRWRRTGAPTLGRCDNPLVMTRRHGVGVALSILAGLLLAGCGGGHAASKGSKPSPSARPSPSASARPTPSPSNATVLVCQATAMTASQGQSDSAAGHIVYAFVLTNTGAQPCTLDGYPAVQLVAANGSLSTTQSNGNDGVTSVSTTPELVTIAAGGSASFVLQYSDVPTGIEACPAATQLQIVLPGGGGTVPASADIDPCGGDLYVSPVRAGTAPP